MIVYYCCLTLVQLQSRVHFQITAEDFPLLRQLNLHANFLTVIFLANQLRLMVLPFSPVQCNNFTCPVIHKTFRLPCKTNHGTPGRVDISLDFLISLKVPKSTRSENSFFFPVLFSLARPTLCLCLFSLCTYFTCAFTLYNSP